jgi:hypothetical protein
VSHPQIAAFARLAKENTPPVRALEGQKTLLTRTVHGFKYDETHDEIVVPSPLTQAILVFRGDAHGEEPPIRVIQGSQTQILGTGPSGNDKLSLDEVNGEYYLPILDGVLVFDRLANGNVAPKRVLKGPDTGILGIAAVEPDPVHDRLVIKGERNSLLIFDRTASGNAKPLSVIQGPQVRIAGLPHQHRIYAPKGWIVVGINGGALGVWSIDDKGDVPPRWRIPVRQLVGKGEGASSIALDPVHKELLCSSGSGNRLITFYFPELF